MGRLSEDIPIAWIIFPSRTLAVLVVTVPLALAGRLRMTREAAPLVLASGLLEVAGLVAFTIGARHGIAVAAVLGSQFAAIATRWRRSSCSGSGWPASRSSGSR